jgi:hypothetical protein
LFNIKTYPLTFIESPKTLHGDGGMVDKNVSILTIRINKAKTFGLVKPLYASFCHNLIPPLELFLKLGYGQKKASGIKAQMP